MIEMIQIKGGNKKHTILYMNDVLKNISAFWSMVSNHSVIMKRHIGGHLTSLSGTLTGSWD